MRIPFIKYNHQKYLNNLAKIEQSADAYQILYTAKEYKECLLHHIKKAETRIYLVALYLEKDEAGVEILQALYDAKIKKPHLDIKVFVDWHRAQRGRIGEQPSETNATFYHQMKQEHPTVDIKIYGVPINRREILGVLHLKGSMMDNTLLYSGASINNIYLHQHDKYRYDRYHIITNQTLVDSMVEYIDNHLLTFNAVQRIDGETQKTRKQLKADIQVLRQYLTQINYDFRGMNPEHRSLSVTPIAGLGKMNELNKVIHHLICSTEDNIIFCTPYFNLPTVIMKDIFRLLRKGKKVEIIVGDKTANDFYIPEGEPFNIAGGLPYLYEINLRKFVERLQGFIDKNQLTIRLWKDGENSYHLKGIWVDNQWALITGNNINPRAWRLDLENGILVHDPQQVLHDQFKQELKMIRENTLEINHFQQIQASQFYPKAVDKLISRLSRIRVDRIIKRLL